MDCVACSLASGPAACHIIEELFMHILLRTILLMLGIATSVWAGGNVTVTEDDKEADGKYDKEETVVYTATWTPDSSGALPDGNSYQWTVSGDAKLFSGQGNETIKIHVNSATVGTKNFEASVTTSWTFKVDGESKTVDETRSDTGTAEVGEWVAYEEIVVGEVVKTNKLDIPSNLNLHYAKTGTPEKAEFEIDVSAATDNDQHSATKEVKDAGRVVRLQGGEADAGAGYAR